MILFIYGAILGYMLFFAIFIAPASNKVLDKNNRSLFLRNIFPKNFLFGLFLSFSAIAVSLYQGLDYILYPSVSIFIGFIVNYSFIMPKINIASEKINITNENNAKNIEKHKKEFRYLHLTSVIIYTIQLLTAFYVTYIMFQQY